MSSLCGQINEMRHKSHINMVVGYMNVKHTNRYIINKLSTSTQTRILLTTELLFFIKYSAVKPPKNNVSIEKKQPRR